MDSTDRSASPAHAARWTRRTFLGHAAAFSAAIGAGCRAVAAETDAATGGARADEPAAGALARTSSDEHLARLSRPRRRLVVSTWDFGAAANEAAWPVLGERARHPVYACEAGVRVTEADESISSVGYGGTPNANGVVELDSAVMRGDTLACGSVGGLQQIVHPVSVAVAVMDASPHVLLVGEGAREFALSQGFEPSDLLTSRANERYQKWRARQREAAGAPADDAEALEPWEQGRPRDDHDTIGMIALRDGVLGTAVTTSGLAFKLPGRVGDSPVIGAGGYCDDEAGAAVSTGIGEEVIRACGSFAVVEAMRRGSSPEEACREVLVRIRRNMTRLGHAGQVAFIAVAPDGRVAGMALERGFTFALTDEEGTELHDAVVV